MELKEKIYRFRSDHDMTQERFAEVAGVTRVAVNRIELGKIKKVHARTFKKIMNVIDKKGA